MLIIKDSRFCVVFIIGHSVRFCQVFACVLDDSLFICKASSRPFPMGEALIYDSKPHYRR